MGITALYGEKLYNIFNFVKDVFNVDLTLSDLFNEMNLVTGGMSAVCNAYGNVHDLEKCRVTMELKTKVLYENIDNYVIICKNKMIIIGG